MIWGKASDLSLGGCFVEMPIPLPVDSKFEIAVWLGDTKLRLRGQAASTSPGFGVGVRFIDVSPENQEFLCRHVLSIA